MYKTHYSDTYTEAPIWQSRWWGTGRYGQQQEVGTHEQKVLELGRVTRVVESTWDCFDEWRCGSFDTQDWYLGGMECRVRRCFLTSM